MHERPGRRARRAAALAALPVAALFALSACTSSGTDDGGGGEAAADMAPEQEAGAEPGQDDGSAAEAPGAGEAAEGAEGDEAPARAASDPAVVQAHLIRTARVVVATEDVAGQYDRAVDLAAAAGGYVAGENTERDAAGSETSHVTLKVPADRYEELLADVSGLGELEHREVTTEDVTDQVVDVESRIATQEESVERIRRLLEQAGSIDDIVDIESELSTRQADLESLQSQFEALRDRTGLATIALELREPDAPAREEEDEDEAGPSVLGGLSGGWDAFVTSLTWLAAVLSAALPFLALIALILLGWRLAAGRLARRHTTTPAAAPGPAPGAGPQGP
ncbi:DUF4349 domain-containing protein [Streptomyces sp. MP131-18]|uniref:DUF4349 domain-containing protein n=1 Tax=Streptomyces sp. MP131-18 TaxID=1857892 RepID=UPI00097BB510|nr:DUF4349 domain-containing protein [Streptomyces sp. MP131-18]ONK10668.1 hypothetical protein STBA_13910 [Streptomyces sp. MP131-18]